MTRIITLLIFSFIIHQSQAQSARPLNGLNDTLNYIYSQVFENVDTSYINYRKECKELVKQENKEMQFNGYLTLALLDMYAKKYNSSIAEFKKAISLDSTCFICYRKLHWVYWYGKNNYDAATSLWKVATRRLETVISLDSANADNWERLYIIYNLNEGTLPKPVKERMKYIARKVVELDSTNAYYWWQYSFHLDHEPANKEYALTQAYSLNPQSSIYWNALAYFYFEKKNIPKLKQVLDSGRPSKGDMDLEYWYQQKAYYYFHLGLKTEARDVYKEAKSHGFEINYK
jgi:hypothetical protein